MHGEGQTPVIPQRPPGTPKPQFFLGVASVVMRSMRCIISGNADLHLKKDVFETKNIWAEMFPDGQKN